MVPKDMVLRTRQGFTQKLPHAAPRILRTTNEWAREDQLDVFLSQKLSGCVLGTSLRACSASSEPKSY